MEIAARAAVDNDVVYYNSPVFASECEFKYSRVLRSASAISYSEMLRVVLNYR